MGEKPPPEEPSAGAAPQSDRTRLGKYQLQRKIGSGGMGSVFLARDAETGRTVALKILPREKAANPVLVRRFEAEAESAAQLRHESIVNVYEAGQIDGLLYIALEYVEGTDVQRLVARRGVIPVRRSIEILKQVARALEHAFRQGIVHRDIKPSNLLIRPDGTVKLADMGLARSVDESLDTSLTKVGTTVGTVDYMAPEQARDSKSADVRSDVYSLGCAWYFMLTGEPPFPHGSVTNKLYAHFARPRPDPREKNGTIPPAIVTIMHRMMARAPRDRYQTPTDLLEDLERLSYGREMVSDRFVSTLNQAVQPGPPAASGRGTPQPVRTVRRPRRTGEARRLTVRIEPRRLAAVVLVVLVAAALVWGIAAIVASSFDRPEPEGGESPFVYDERPNASGAGVRSSEFSFAGRRSLHKSRLLTGKTEF